MADNEPERDESQDATEMPGPPAGEAGSSGAARRPAGRLLAVLVPAVLLIVVFAAYVAWQEPPAEDLRPAPVTLLCATADCGFSEVRVLELQEVLPARCPNCGKDSVYCARKCPKCGAAFIMNEDRGLPGPTKCPKCSTPTEHGM